MLAEIKAALGNDSVKFSQAFAKPFLVERMLRDKFENDEALHAAQRREAGQVREKLVVVAAAAKSEVRSPKAEEVVGNLVALLKASHTNEVSETTWQLTPRPAETNAPAPDELEMKKRFGPNAQIVSSPRGAERDRKLYFEDLPPALQDVLRVQLRQPGDVSAVIEAPGGFLLYVAKEKTDIALAVACLSLPKRGYDQWLEEQK
jgi:hypothetical protein